MKRLRKLFVVFMAVALMLSTSVFAEEGPGNDGPEVEQRQEIQDPDGQDDEDCGDCGEDNCDDCKDDGDENEKEKEKEEDEDECDDCDDKDCDGDCDEDEEDEDGCDDCDDEDCDGDCDEDEEDECCDHCGEDDCDGDCQHQDCDECTDDHSFEIEIKPVKNEGSDEVQLDWSIGEEVFFMVTVTNTSDAPMDADIEVDNADEVGSGDDVVTIEALAAGASSILYFSKSYPVSGGPGLRVTEAEATANWSCCCESPEMTEATEPDAWINLEPQPAVSVIKTSPQSEWDVGDNISFGVTVTNDGDVDLENFQIIDELLGYDSGTLTEVLEPGESFDFDIPVTYLAETSGDLKNEVLVKAYYVPEVEGGDGFKPDGIEIECGLYTTMVSAVGEITVTILAVDDPVPAIEVSKTVDSDTFNVNDTVIYTITVTNTGNVDFDEVWLYDEDNAGNLFYFDELYDASGGAYGPGLLAGASAVLTPSISYAEPMTDLINEIVVEGYANYELVAENSAETSIDITAAASVLLEKSAPSAVDLGQDITYTFTITNDGEAALDLTELVDDILPDSPFDLTGTTLAPGEYTSFDATLPADNVPALLEGNNVVHNEATVTATSSVGSAESSATADVTINMVMPALSLDKEAAEAVNLGEDIVYTFTILNTGEVDVQLTELVDPMLPDSPIDLSAVSLAPGSSHSITSTLSGDLVESEMVDGAVTNTATVYGEVPDIFGDFVSDIVPAAFTISASDTNEVDVLYAEISVTKEADGSTYDRGDTVEYTITVTNTGTIDFYEVWLYDEDNAGNLFYFDELYDASAGEYGPGLAAGESATLIVRTSYGSSYSSLINEIDVEGYYGDLEDLQFVEDSAQVEITIEGSTTTTSSKKKSSSSSSSSSEEETIIAESVIPESVPVDLTIVVEGDGNIESQVVNFPLNGDVYTFGPLEGANGYQFISIGGPDSSDLIMVDPTTFNLVMDDSKEIHIVFKGVEIRADILDETTPLADMPTTGGLPITVPMVAGIVSMATGIGLKKKR